MDATLHAAIKLAVAEALREELPKLLREDPNQYVGVREAAKKLGLAVATVYELSASLALPSIKMGKSLRFKVSDLSAYAEQGRRSREAVAKLVP